MSRRLLVHRLSFLTGFRSDDHHLDEEERDRFIDPSYLLASSSPSFSDLSGDYSRYEQAINPSRSWMDGKSIYTVPPPVNLDRGGAPKPFPVRKSGFW